MARKKKESASGSEFSLFDETEVSDADSEEDLPRDEIGRAKIKQQYVELLSIRIAKLAGRILNRERINKTLEGIYFVCALCKKVCHNLDEGLIEDETNVNNVCTPCAEAAKTPPRPARKKAAKKKAAAVAS
ncbi:MAG: hypothetical protein ACI91F_000763 [Candidatus Binatia bacterium]